MTLAADTGRRLYKIDARWRAQTLRGRFLQSLIRMEIREENCCENLGTLSIMSLSGRSLYLLWYAKKYCIILNEPCLRYTVPQMKAFRIAYVAAE